MKLRYIISIGVLCLFPSFKSLNAQILVPSFKDSHQIISLNGTWKFKYFPSADVGTDTGFYEPSYNIANWADIKVPGNWEMQGFAEPAYARRLREATGLYHTGFSIPANWKENPVYIAFDGVEFGYTVWVNGCFVGTFASAFNRQTFDISKFAAPGKTNTLAVKVITHPKGWEFDTNDDWALSGISRSVTVFSLAPVHIKDVLVKTSVSENSASVNIQATIEKTLTTGFTKELRLLGQLSDASGKLVKLFDLPAEPSTNNLSTIIFSTHLHIKNPILWTAETPYLYTLRLSLKNSNNELQQYTDHVGIREVTWKNGILKLNGQPIKLKGITHHDLSPINGRAITEAEMIKDLKLMHEANINFIRTSHYPPAPRFLELCDSLGFYVMDEVPFGFGEEHLTDTSYLPILMLRAKATIDRDKNRPCVIIWSVGNENPVTDIGLKTGRYVKSIDNTRPYCFPQTPTVFENMLKSIPDSLDILDDHYPTVADLKRFAPTIDRPMVASEYAHALGLDFNSMEAIYEEMYANPKMAGGAVWEFFDQGILRRSPQKVAKGEPTFYAWPSADSFYNTSTNEGTDGIVYANRVPQVDYWQARKVYTPVKALDDKLMYEAGKQDFKIKLINRYDFTDLSAVNCKWQLFADTVMLSAGTLLLNCKPHDTVTVAINPLLPPKPLANFYYLKIVFEDKNQYRFYEKVYPVNFKETRSMLAGIVAGNNSKPVKTENTVMSENYRFEFEPDSGQIQLKSTASSLIIANGPFARVGRKATMAQDATTQSRRSKLKHTIWDPFLLTKSQMQVKSFDSHRLVVDYKFQPDSPKQHLISGTIVYRFSDSGYINLNYHLLSEGKEQATEMGVSFVIPASFTEFRWVGKGPYEAYPGKDKLSEFGIYHLNSSDIYFAGNRQNVTCALFTNEKGDGFALVADNANISVERTAAGIVVSHNASVAGRFNKYEWPEDLYQFGDKAIDGNFSIVPFTAKTYPALLKNIFGDIEQSAKPFQPFYHSYDQ